MKGVLESIQLSAVFGILRLCEGQLVITLDLTIDTCGGDDAIAGEGNRGGKREPIALACFYVE